MSLQLAACVTGGWGEKVQKRETAIAQEKLQKRADSQPSGARGVRRRSLSLNPLLRLTLSIKKLFSKSDLLPEFISFSPEIEVIRYPYDRF
jgi:hypothetical protein